MKILDLLTKEQLAKCASLKKYKKGDTIFNEGDLCQQVGIVDSGVVDIVSYSYSGSTIVYNTVSNNQLFGNNLIFSSNPRFKGNVVSRTDTTIFFINKENLIYLLENNKKFLISFLEYQSNFGIALNQRIKLLSLDSAESRLLFFIKSNGGRIDYTSITSLASTLNLQRETLSRLMSKLEKKHVIRRANKQIILND